MQHLDLKTLVYLLCTTIHDLKGQVHYSQLLQCTKYINSLTVTLLIAFSLEKHLVGQKSLQTLGIVWFIPSHYLEAVDNYNKEKVIITNKITPTTGINEAAKMPLLKLFLYFSIRDKCLLIK